MTSPRTDAPADPVAAHRAALVAAGARADHLRARVANAGRALDGARVHLNRVCGGLPYLAGGPVPSLEALQQALATRETELAGLTAELGRAEQSYLDAQRALTTAKRAAADGP